MPLDGHTRTWHSKAVEAELNTLQPAKEGFEEQFYINLSVSLRSCHEIGSESRSHT